MYLTMPDPDTLARVKVAALNKLLELGAINALEVGPLSGMHVDTVLDRVFEHCGEVRARMGDNRWLIIRPGDKPCSMN